MIELLSFFSSCFHRCSVIWTFLSVFIYDKFHYSTNTNSQNWHVHSYTTGIGVVGSARTCRVLNPGVATNTWYWYLCMPTNNIYIVLVTIFNECDWISHLSPGLPDGMFPQHRLCHLFHASLCFPYLKTKQNNKQLLWGILFTWQVCQASKHCGASLNSQSPKQRRTILAPAKINLQCCFRCCRWRWKWCPAAFKLNFIVVALFSTSAS